MKFIKSYLLSIILLTLFISPGYSEVELSPLHAGLALEYGQMNNLNYFVPGDDETFTINRTIGWFYQHAKIDERLDANLALGGLFFNFFPSNGGQDFTKWRVSAVSVAEASGTYKFGDLEDPSLKISFGLMTYKYNRESKNLGEYLFRSTPYPNTTINGSWDLINSSYSKIKGIKLNKSLMDGKWNNDVIFATSDEIYPLHDLNLAYVTDYTFGPVTVGAGINMYKVIPVRPSLTTPETNSNSYFTHNGTTYYGDKNYYKQVGIYFDKQADDFEALGTPAGDIEAARLRAIDTSYIVMSDLVDSLNTADSLGTMARDYYTFQGTLLMGRATFDVGSLIGENMDFKIYSEVDLLGVTDYPIFFEEKMERMPIMFGVHLPTFGVLDFLAVEGEYWENRYPIITLSSLTPGHPKVDYGRMSPAIDITQPYTEDDWKWSVSAQRSVGNYFTINAQAARDHTRPIRFDFSPFKFETLLESDAWYYILRVQVNM